MTEINLTKESQNIEFKESFNEKALQTLSAFANTEGGTLLVGIADDKTIKGVSYTNEEIEKLTNQIVSKLGIHPSIKLEEESGKEILRIEVQKYSVPIHLSGKYYKRVGNTTRLMQPEELRDFLIKDTNWDSLTNDYKIGEIDKHTVEIFIKLAKKSGRIKVFDQEDDVTQILESLNLIIDGKLTNAAIILFGKNPQRRFTNTVVRIIKLKDDITSIADKLIEGNLFYQAIEAEEIIKNYINVKYEIKGELQRTEIWDYPLEALREMLFNALIHRDYFNKSIQTQIKIYDDYLWTSNAGALPQGITIDQLQKAHRSISRNPLIMDIFYRAGFVEEFGSGTRRIIKAFKEANLPPPEFKEEFSGFSVYFRKDKLNEDYLNKQGLNSRQVKAVFYVKEKRIIKSSEYQDLTGASRATAKRDLDELCKKDIFMRLGSGRNITYQISGSNGS